MRIMTAAIVALLMTAPAAAAHPSTGSGWPELVEGQEPSSDEAGAGLSPGEIQRLFDAYAVVQAQQMLKLTDAQYPQFVTRLKTLQETRRRNQQGRNRILQALNRLSRQEPPADEAVIREQLKTLQDHDGRAAAELRTVYDALDQLLDVRQQARFRLFEEQMERRKFEFLMRARQNRQRAPARPNRNRPPVP